MRIMAARLPGQLRGGDAVLHGDVGVLRGEPYLDHLVGTRLVMEKIADALLVGAQERIDLVYPVDVKAGGADQGERGKPAGITHRDLRGDPAAKRDADQMDTVEIERCEEVEVEIGEVMDSVEPIWGIGFAEARMLRSDHLEPCSER